MKTILFSLSILICSCVVVSAQEKEQNDEVKTLFGNKDIAHGGYGGFGVSYGIVDNRHALFSSGRAAWIIDHSLAIGVAGSGFINDYESASDIKTNHAGGYGGLLIEPIIFGKFPVHISLPIIVGAGGIASNETDEEWNTYVNDVSPFAVLEAGAEVELNMTKFFRVAVGGTYRYTSRLELFDASSTALNGFTGGITFKFGYF